MSADGDILQQGVPVSYTHLDVYKRQIQLLWPNLPVAVNAPTKQARDKVSEGSYWAGRAINITKTDKLPRDRWLELGLTDEEKQK